MWNCGFFVFWRFDRGGVSKGDWERLVSEVEGKEERVVVGGLEEKVSLKLLGWNELRKENGFLDLV